MTFISYAQNFEDVLLWRALGSVGRGFYIDVGAAHPDVDSVTRAFYERGWRGINVEPVADYVQRLQASRPEDVTLRTAASDRAGVADLFVVGGTGLSTLDRAALARLAAHGFDHETSRTTTETLANICRLHAPADIHFLKVDVEGNEAAVLAGADFTAFRPWVVLVEATEAMSTTASHAAWEPGLLAADYRFVWFDGLNRFYVAAERHAALARHFAAPPNVFDDFVRAADSEWTRRIAEAETRASEAAARAAGAARGEERIGTLLHATEQRAAGEAVRASELAAAASHLRLRLEAEAAEAARLRHALAEAAARLAELSGQALARMGESGARAEDAERRARAASDWLLAMRHSNSWRVTAPARRVASLLRRGAAAPALPAIAASPIATTGVAAPAVAAPVVAAAVVAPPAEPPPPAPTPVAAPLARIPAGVGPGRRAVHQFHSGSAVADAITNAMLLTRRVLRAHGYASEIFVEHRAPELAHELRRLDELPTHDDYVLVIRHSTGHDALARILALPAPKVLIYHNITPPELLGRDAFTQRYAELGRAQLATLRAHVAAALADSEFNALELRRVGFAAPRACCLLFDVVALAQAAARHAQVRPTGTRTGARTDAPFTVLFVGRIIESKAQADLVDAFARLRAMLDRPMRLVLVGRAGSATEAYRIELEARIRAHRLDASEVVLTGLVGDDALHGWYAAADLYVSLSHHEGFGVPLVEAMAHGVPVLAWPSGAIPYTLGDPDGLLTDRAPGAVAARMRALAEDPATAAALAARQRAGLDRFGLEAQAPALVQALVQAGAAPPEHPATAAALGRAMRFTVAGHVNKSYSLAAINRALALALEATRPGRVRLLAVEGAPTDDLSGVPAEMAAAIAALARRPPHDSAPEIVISQHYPVYVPDRRGDALLALFFWEESLVPAETVARLGAEFRAVLAPSAFVAKALVDSGLAIPVHVVGHAPALDAFAAQGAERLARDAPERLARDAPERAARDAPERALRDAPERALRDAPDGAFTFLHVSSCFPRKGVDVLLAAYARAFRRGDRVRLVIKGFPNPHNDAAAQVAAWRAADPQAPPVELVDRDLDAAAMLALYARADALVLPSRGEGFNLPAAEAMAAGLALIVTGFGGHLDFCDDATARLVAWRYAASTSHLATPHSVWAEPDGDDLTRALREAVAGPAAAQGRARRARLAAARHFDRAAFADRLTTAAAAALLAPPPPPLRIGWISTWRVRCGVAEYSRHLLASLPASDAVQGVVVLADDRAPMAPAPGAADDAAPAGGASVAVRVRPAWRMGHPQGLRDLVTAVAQEDPHVVVVQHQPGLFHWHRLAELLAGLAGRAVVVTLHNTRDLLVVPDGERRAALAALAGAARVLVHTLADLNRLKELGLFGNVALLAHGAPPPGPATPPRTLHAVTLDASRPAASRLDASGAAPLVGCYGFLLPDKGIPQLVEALALLRQRWPGARLRLVNAQYDGPEGAAELARCRAVAVEAGVAEAVEWRTDFLPDAESRALLAECDVVALPYQRSLEASSAALRIALSAGVPVLTTRLAVFDEAGEAVARCGGTDAELASGLGRLFEDPARRAGLQAAARAWLEARDWRAVGRRLEGMLRGLALAPPPASPRGDPADAPVARPHDALVEP